MATFDHRLINDVVDFHPTSEHLARHFARWFHGNIETTTPVTLISRKLGDIRPPGLRSAQRFPVHTARSRGGAEVIDVARNAHGDRSRVPAWIEPMLAKPDGGRLPTGSTIVYEHKLDGSGSVRRFLNAVVWEPVAGVLLVSSWGRGFVRSRRPYCPERTAR
jgi:hypothetical protein